MNLSVWLCFQTQSISFCVVVKMFSLFAYLFFFFFVLFQVAVCLVFRPTVLHIYVYRVK